MSGAPRLVSTAAAREYLGGRHPATIGAQPIGNGRGQLWDLRQIDARLDVLSGLAASATRSPANDETDELDQLAQRIANASRRA